MEQVIEHLREGDGHHDEEDPRGADDQYPHQQRGQGADAQAQRQGDPDTQRLIFGGEQHQGIAGHAEEGRRGQADHAADPDQQVEAEGDNGQDHGAGQLLEEEVVPVTAQAGAEHRVSGHQQQQQRQKQLDRAR